MLLKHIAVECSSEKNSDNFYEKLLGLNKINSKILSPALTKQIFGLDSEYKIINYMDDKIHFEVFISNQKAYEKKTIEHVCLEVDDLKVFMKQCENLAANIIQIPKGESSLTFISDYDGNLFEIKEKQ